MRHVSLSSRPEVLLSPDSHIGAPAVTACKASMMQHDPTARSGAREQWQLRNAPVSFLHSVLYLNAGPGNPVMERTSCT